MKEFLIRRNDQDFLLLPISKYSAVLTPKTLDAKPAEGSGEFCLAIDDGIVSFSFEEPGVHIVFESENISDKDVTEFVKEVMVNIETEIGYPCYFIAL